MTAIRARWILLLDRLVRWLDVDDLDDDSIPEVCDVCGEERPADPWRWERWEMAHEEHPELAW